MTDMPLPPSPSPSPTTTAMPTTPKIRQQRIPTQFTSVPELCVIGAKAISTRYPGEARAVRNFAARLRRQVYDANGCVKASRLQEDLISLASSREFTRRLLMRQLGEAELTPDQIATYAVKAAWQANERTKIVRELLAPAKDATAADLYTERVVSKDCSLPLGDDLQVASDGDSLADLIADDEMGE